jgi:probable rRNA maturation factor
LIILQKPVEGVSEQSLSRFVTHARRAAGVQGQVNVLVTSNHELHELNRRFRGKDKPTDVLSFPSAADGARFSGDIAISADIARASANQLGHAPAQEIKILVLHGLLHLAGYDHETDNGTMARKEVRLRRELKLPESLTERNKPSTPGAGRRRS